MENSSDCSIWNWCLHSPRFISDSQWLRLIIYLFYWLYLMMFACHIMLCKFRHTVSSKRSSVVFISTFAERLQGLVPRGACCRIQKMSNHIIYVCLNYSNLRVLNLKHNLFKQDICWSSIHCYEKWDLCGDHLMPLAMVCLNRSDRITHYLGKWLPNYWGPR